MQAGFRVAEVPIVFRDREQGQSKMSWRIAAEAMWLVPAVALQLTAPRRPMDMGWTLRPMRSPMACGTPARPCSLAGHARCGPRPVGRRLRARRRRAARGGLVVATLDGSYTQTIQLQPPFAVGDWRDVLRVLRSNLLVLALHAMACVAGFIAGSSLPLQAEHHRGVSRWVHEHGGRLAIAFVVCATTFSLSAQAYVIGHTLAGSVQLPARIPGAPAAGRPAARRFLS